MNKQNIFSLLFVAVVMFVIGFYTSQNSIQTPSAITSSELSPTTNVPEAPIPTQETENKQDDTIATVAGAEKTKWKTFTSKEYGFEFQYPAQWIVSEKLTGNKIDTTGKEYVVFATITHPDRAGKIDTGTPVEKITLSNGVIGCEGMGFGPTGMRAVTGKWELGYGSNYYRTLCFVTDGNISKYWTLNISMSAFDKESQALMDEIMSTLKFFEHSFVYN